MKRLKNVGLAIMVVAMMFPVWSASGQTPVKSQAVKVPITYTGDTNETINRRAQWMEGAKKEGTLVWWGTLTPGEGAKVIAEFNKIYPFITVNYWRGKGEEITSKLDLEFASGRFTVDVTLGGGSEHFPRWRKLGMIEKYTDIIPGIGKFDKRMFSAHGDYFSPGSYVITPQYNTKLVSAAEAPKKWEELLDSKWKGKVGMTTDMKPWAAIALAEGGWGIEQTEDFLRKLKQQQPIWATSHTSGHQLLIAGEFKILVEGYLYQVLQSQKKDAPVDWCRVNAIPVVTSGMSLRRNAPHPNAAKLFLEWLLSAQGLVTYERITSLGSAFQGSGTIQSKLVEGIKLYPDSEDTQLKRINLNLDKRFSAALGAAIE